MLNVLGGALSEKEVPPKLDWDKLFQLGHQHRTIPLFRAGLKQLQVELPASEADYLRKFCRGNSMKCLSFMASLQEILTVLNRHKIPAYPYKGPYLALLAHGDPSLRVFGDLDVVIGETDVLVACEVLSTIGYEPCFGWVSPRPFLAFHYEYRLQHRDTGRVLELKWKIAPNRFVRWGTIGSTWTESQVAALSNRTCWEPSLEELFVCLVIHGSKHLWSRLQWLCDLAALLSHELDIGAIREHAHRCSSVRALDVAFFLLCDSLKVSLSEHNDQVLRKDTQLLNTARRIQASWRIGGELSNREEKMLLLQFFDTPCQKLRYLSHSAVSPTPADILAVPWELSCLELYYLARPLRYLARWAGFDILKDPRH